MEQTCSQEAHGRASTYKSFHHMQRCLIYSFAHSPSSHCQTGPFLLTGRWISYMKRKDSEPLRHLSLHSRSFCPHSTPLYTFSNHDVDHFPALLPLPPLPTPHGSSKHIFFQESYHLNFSLMINSSGVT